MEKELQNTTDRKVILYISMSIDGYLAGLDDDLSWLSVVERAGEDYGYSDFNQLVDTYIVGRKTYDKILSLTGGDFPPSKRHDCYVLTRQPRNSEGQVTFYHGDVAALISRLKDTQGKHIYCDGGAEIVKLFMERNLIDEYVISIIPTFLGNGKRLFQSGFLPVHVRTKSVEKFDSGLIQVTYERLAV